MATSRLLLYNGAVLLMGERQLSSITENVEVRRVLDIVWDTGAIDYVLEQGLWNFALRTAMIDYSPSVSLNFGYSRAFDKPTDWIRTAALCSDEYFNEPLNQYADEAGFWYTDLETIYAKFVSNGADYGNDLSLWPQTFVKYASAYLAHTAAQRLAYSSERVDKIEKAMKAALMEAQSRDAMNEPTRFAPRGQWVRARQGRGRGDRGNNGGLIG